MKNANKPAMPQSLAMNNDDGYTTSDFYDHTDFNGLTKREMFAMHAMSAWVQHHGSSGSYGFDEKECARRSIECADALLSELEK